MHEKIFYALQESPLFNHLSHDEIDRLLDLSTVEEFKESETIIKENEPVESLYIVLKGRVRVWTTGPRGEVELKKLGRGAYFGEVSLISGNAATANVEVVHGPASLIAIDSQGLNEFVESDDRVRKMLQGVTLARAKDTIGKVFK